MKLDNTEYREHQRKIRHENYRRNHYCCDCGIYSKENLTAGHPDKDGKICEQCRVKLWEIK